MSRGPCTFRQRDLTAAVKAAQAAGLFVASVEIEGGKIRIISGKPDAAPASTGDQELVETWPALPGRNP